MADTTAPRRFADIDLYIAVAVGGVLGALARHGFDLLIPDGGNGWPTATFVVNLTGAFILGVVIVIATELFADPTASVRARRFRPFVVTGVLGGYTTFSTFMVEAHTLFTDGQSVLAAAYVFGSLVAGVFMVGLAMWLAGLVVRRVYPGRDEDESPTVRRHERIETEEEG